MKNKLIIFLVLMFGTMAVNAQKYYLRTNGTTTPVDPHLGTTLSFKMPVLMDTTAALTAAGIDSCGIIFKEFLTSNVWIRDTILTGGHKWTLLQASSSPGNDSAFVWGYGTGTLSDQVDLQNALNNKQNVIGLGTTSQYFRGDLSLATFPTLLSSFTNDAGFLTSVLDTNSITGTGIAGGKLQLVNDVAGPGATKYYGTGSGGTKGWFTLPSGTGTVTSISAAAPITGGTITATGTIGLDTSTAITGATTLYQNSLRLRIIDTRTVTGIAIPSGAGNRFMYLPDKGGSIRVGIASGTEWNADSIGTTSYAFGQSIKVTGQYSGGFGSSSTVSGTGSVAFGSLNTVGGTFSTTSGEFNNVSGNGSVAFGNAITVSGTGSAGFGLNSMILSDGGATFGNGNRVSGASATTIGTGLTAKNSNLFVIGKYNDSTSAISIFEVGNGLLSGARKNAFMIDSFSRVYISQAPATGTTTDSVLVRLTATGQVKMVAQSSISGGGGNPNSNVGSGYRLAVPNTNNIKTLFTPSGVLIDSTTNTNGLTLRVDTTVIATLYDLNNNFDTVKIIPFGTSGVSLLRGSHDSLRPKPIIAGTNITLTQNSDSTVTIASSGGITNNNATIDTVLRLGSTSTRNISVGQITSTNTPFSAYNSKIKVVTQDTTTGILSHSATFVLDSTGLNKNQYSVPSWDTTAKLFKIRSVQLVDTSGIATGKIVYWNGTNFAVRTPDTIYRTVGKDSIQFTIGGRYHSILDSAGGGGSGNTNSNIGSGYRFAVPTTNNIKTLFCSGCTLDSTTNTNALTLTVTAGGSGTVTSVATGLGLSGGTITSSGTIIADTSYLMNKSTAQTVSGKKTFTDTLFATSKIKFSGILTTTPTPAMYVIVQDSGTNILSRTPYYAIDTTGAYLGNQVVYYDTTTGTKKFKVKNISGTNQVITTGTTATVTGSNYRVIFDPSSTISTFTLTLPASPVDGQTVEIFAGGTVTTGAVVTTLTISPNSGQTILQAATPTTISAGGFIKYFWRSSISKWYREN